ncbi:trypsin-like peptidase domain-containing protein [Comamonas piscis]
MNGLVHTHLVVLPALEWEKTLSSDTTTNPAMRIGIARTVDATSSVAQTQAALRWNALPHGQHVAAINIQSTGAYGLRAGVLVERIPDAAQLRIYSQEHPDAIIERSGAEINALLALNRDAGERDAAANTWWTPNVGAGDTTVEVMLPAGTPADALRISIPKISHIYQNLSLPTEAEWLKVNQTQASQAENPASCSLDATCKDSYQIERNAVARMMFTVADGNTYKCTGTLLNNVKGDYAPFFLTANHCISTQAEASTLQTDWFYRSSSCNSTVPGANGKTRSAGATLLYATDTTDSSLLRLNEMPPAGVTLAGWDARSDVKKGDAVYGLHHAKAELLKYSVGEISDYSACVWSLFCYPSDTNSDYYSVQWSEGTTEKGSSGSALFRNDRVIGALYGGNSTCNSRRGASHYGRFDKVFNSHLWRWLAS